MRRRGAWCAAIDLAAAALLGAVVGVSAAWAQDVPTPDVRADTLSYDQARLLAENAWISGNVPLANQLARLMSEARPDDVAALLMLSATETALGRPEEGRAAGRRAFAQAESDAARYQAAYLASSGAMADERYGAAQYWLRRAYQSAETETQRDRIAGAFGAVRRASPWQVRLAFNVAPSSNVNGGSDSPFLVIDDSPFVGVLSGAARALSGVEASVTGTFAYTFAETAAGRTSLAFHGYRSFVFLSEEAQDIAPRAEGSDFEYGVGEIELRHQIADAPGPLPDTYSLAFGQTWYGGDRLDRVGRLTLARTFNLSARTGLRFTAEGERRLSDTGAQDRTGSELAARFFHRLDNGTVLRFGLSGTQVASDDGNAAYTGYEVHAGFWMGEAVSGVRLSGRVAYNERSYEEYSVGFIDVPGGRDDTEWSARLNLHVDQIDVFGFVPVVSLIGSTSTSNVSRFEGESLGVSLGFESAF
ncbi:MAG: surface lipoprotein assembly modifier [Pseudomonadota bacterium]